jgi:hypothetical protein
MTFDQTELETPDTDSSQFQTAARGHLVLASIAFGGGMPCLGQKYLGDAVLAFEHAAAAVHKELS